MIIHCTSGQLRLRNEYQLNFGVLNKVLKENLSLNRYIEIASYHIERLELDLKGLHVLTECASKAYAFTPVMAAMAGANVISLGRDTQYGSFSSNKEMIEHLLNKTKAKGNIEFHENKVPEKVLLKTNIVTNSGLIRPITSDFITKLNSKSVICLMWETWEFRTGEIDIITCQKRGIPVVGTNENYKDANMYDYPGMLCIKLLMEMSLEVANNSFILLGEGLTGSLIAKTFTDLGVEFKWFVDSKEKYRKQYECYNYSDLRSILSLNRVDAIICADHVTKRQFIGKAVGLPLIDIKRTFPNIMWAHLTGPIDIQELQKSGIPFYPSNLKPTGYMSYETIELGWEPVITLNCAGLKVGEITARRRENGETASQAIKAAVDHGIGQDFSGGFINYRV